MLTSVLLPQPDGPIRAVSRPASSVKEQSSRTGWRNGPMPKLLLTLLTSRRAGALSDEVELVMAGTGTPLRLRSGDPVVPAIHVLARGKDVDAREAQTSLRSLRKLDCARGHDGENALAAPWLRSAAARASPACREAE